MAGGVLQFALQKFDSLLIQEEQHLKGVGQGIKHIRGELEFIRAYLQDTRVDTEGMKILARQLRESTKDIEDVHADYIFYFGHSHGHGVINFLHRKAHYIRHLRTRHRIATTINDIQSDIHTISQRIGRYSVPSVDGGMRSDAASDRLQNEAALYAEEAELVGIDEPREKLIGWLIGGEEQLKVISVVGMTGSGKTTLVKKVYDDVRVKRWFNSHAWVSVTRSYTRGELLQSIISQFHRERDEPLPEIENKGDIHLLIGLIRDFLQDRRYVVVFDDVCDVNAWDSLKHALPNNRCGSRVLVTTRIGNVGVSCQESCGHIYKLHGLTSAMAWSLFCMKAFRSTPGRVCPPELEDIAHSFVRICEGLPLAIVAIAGLLSKKKSLVEWQTASDSYRTEWANDTRLVAVRKIVSLSYNDLSETLKSCFLYFSMFPKDCPVKRITLIRLWIAEGFIESDTRETMETVAEGYLNDLIDRNMVQVEEYYDYGRVKSCRVHDMFYEIIITKSKEENFSTSQVRRNTEIYGNIRRVAIHSTSENVLQNENVSQLRAMFIFGAHSMSISYMCNLLHSLRLLRVLDLEGTPIEKFPVELGRLHHLRYLSLRKTKISKIPKSLGKLKNLETLDLKGTSVTELPSEIIKLQKLRHILAYTYTSDNNPPFYNTNGVKVPRGIGGLKELQKLTYIEASEDGHILQELGNLAQLKRLGIVKLRKDDGATLCASIQKMKNLRSLSVTSGMDELLELESLSLPPPNLQRLYLRGPLQRLPHWVPSLRNLVRMRLRWSRLEDDSVNALQRLPSLVELTMIHAFDGVQLKCERGGFQNLRILDLQQLRNLKHVIADGAMPNLQKIYMRGCVQLEMVPQGIGQLKNLKELHLFDMPEAFIQRLRENGADYSNVMHIPIIRSYDSEKRVIEELISPMSSISRPFNSPTEHISK